MKKILLSALILGFSASAFAGFQGNSQTANVMTVQQVKKAPDNSIVALQGKIVQQVGSDDYLFADKTGQIKVEIDNHIWNGLNVTPNDTIRIEGKLDNEIFDRPDIEVHHVKKVN